jgi:hypothetical protein
MVARVIAPLLIFFTNPLAMLTTCFLNVAFSAMYITVFAEELKTRRNLLRRDNDRHDKKTVN